ncbi:MAG: hypothetical protein HQK52_23055 [Oligoflexia bacterium]|nr:hypothetical protein [Oligoflexia bacterium]
MNKKECLLTILLKRFTDRIIPLIMNLIKQINFTFIMVSKKVKGSMFFHRIGKFIQSYSTVFYFTISFIILLWIGIGEAFFIIKNDQEKKAHALLEMALDYVHNSFPGDVNKNYPDFFSKLLSQPYFERIIKTFYRDYSFGFEDKENRKIILYETLDFKIKAINQRTMFSKEIDKNWKITISYIKNQTSFENFLRIICDKYFILLFLLSASTFCISLLFILAITNKNKSQMKISQYSSIDKEPENNENSKIEIAEKNSPEDECYQNSIIDFEKNKLKLHENENKIASLQEQVQSFSKFTIEIKKLLIELQQISDSVHAILADTKNSVNSLKKSSNKIFITAGVIDEVARQANILSINASIESARLGPMGRAFSVIALEVRGLAKKTASSTIDIKKILSENANQVEQGGNFVFEGDLLSKKTSSGIAIIIKHIENFLKLYKEDSCSLHQETPSTEGAEDNGNEASQSSLLNKLENSKDANSNDNSDSESGDIIFL